MSDLSRFLKGNKKKKENVKYVATKSLTDDNGKPLEWTIRPLSTKDNDIIRDECMVDIPIKGKAGVYRQKLDISKYIVKLITNCVVEPDLNNKELQDSYGVMNPEDLIREMIDNPGEYADLSNFIQEINGFDETFSEEVEKAKN